HPLANNQTDPGIQLHRKSHADTCSKALAPSKRLSCQTPPQESHLRTLTTSDPHSPPLLHHVRRDQSE
ncbi:hypothetical protein IWQ62_002319, partial [Dispira parvispora]